MERLVETQPITHAHERHAQRSAKITKHLSDELVQLCFIHGLRHRYLLDFVMPAGVLGPRVTRSTCLPSAKGAARMPLSVAHADGAALRVARWSMSSLSFDKRNPKAMQGGSAIFAARPDFRERLWHARSKGMDALLEAPVRSA